MILSVHLLVACSSDRPLEQPTVSTDSIEHFLALRDGKDYHEMVRLGKEVFQDSLFIPDHVQLFKDLPSSDYSEGLVRYALFSFKGETSLGEIYLILDEDTGEIIEYNYFEAILE